MESRGLRLLGASGMAVVPGGEDIAAAEYALIELV